MGLRFAQRFQIIQTIGRQCERGLRQGILWQLQLFKQLAGLLQLFTFQAQQIPVAQTMIFFLAAIALQDVAQFTCIDIPQIQLQIQQIIFQTYPDAERELTGTADGTHLFAGKDLTVFPEHAGQFFHLSRPVHIVFEICGMLFIHVIHQLRKIAAHGLCLQRFAPFPCRKRGNVFPVINIFQPGDQPHGILADVQIKRDGVLHLCQLFHRQLALPFDECAKRPQIRMIEPGKISGIQQQFSLRQQLMVQTDHLLMRIRRVAVKYAGFLIDLIQTVERRQPSGDHMSVRPGCIQQRDIRQFFFCFHLQMQPQRFLLPSTVAIPCRQLPDACGQAIDGFSFHNERSGRGTLLRLRMQLLQQHDQRLALFVKGRHAMHEAQPLAIAVRLSATHQIKKTGKIPDHIKALLSPSNAQGDPTQLLCPQSGH